MLMAIESIDYRFSKVNTSYLLHLSVEPVAIIVCGSDEIYALDLDANLITLDQLRQDIPELDEIISPFNKA